VSFKLLKGLVLFGDAEEIILAVKEKISSEPATSWR
jgi:hypothetical protein